jgi:hypothetical protein
MVTTGVLNMRLRVSVPARLHLSKVVSEKRSVGAVSLSDSHVPKSDSDHAASSHPHEHCRTTTVIIVTH